MEPHVTGNGSEPSHATHPCSEFGRAAQAPRASCALLYLFLAALSLVTVCGNLLVGVSVLYFKQLHVATNYLIFSLAVADLLVGVLVFPLSMAFTLTSCWHHQSLLCKIRSSLDVTLSTASILHLCCIALERYCAVCHPLSYRSRINPRVVAAMIALSWCASALIGIGIVVAGFNQGKCEDRCLMDALVSTTLACIFSFYIPVLVMLSIYLKIFLVAQRQARSIHSTHTSAAKTESKATKTLAIVMGVFILCWTPYFLCMIFQPLTFQVTPVAVIETLNWFTLSNSMLNPFIYAFFYSWFRSAFRMIISGKIFQGNFTNAKLA